MGTVLNTALIGIDWGTSRLRGFRIGDTGGVLERRENALGIAAIRNGEFDQVLQALVADWQSTGRPYPILMCGMIGSRQGWHEVPYRPCPVRFTDLAGGWRQIDTSCGPAFVVGGVSCTDDKSSHDIMRGEETQIFGVAQPSGRQLVIAPGTHSKWAVIDHGRIENFRTYMTGELYGLLREHSSLGWLMQGTDNETHAQEAFRSGVLRGLDDQELLHMLFGVRTRGLFETAAPGTQASYLSGILIGSEITAGIRHLRADSIIVVAAPALGRLYGIALGLAGVCDIAHVDTSDAAVRGLWRLWQLHSGKG